MLMNVAMKKRISTQYNNIENRESRNVFVDLFGPIQVQMLSISLQRLNLIISEERDMNFIMIVLERSIIFLHYIWFNVKK